MIAHVFAAKRVPFSLVITLEGFYLKIVIMDIIFPVVGIFEILIQRIYKNLFNRWMKHVANALNRAYIFVFHNNFSCSR